MSAKTNTTRKQWANDRIIIAERAMKAKDRMEVAPLTGNCPTHEIFIDAESIPVFFARGIKSRNMPTTAGCECWMRHHRYEDTA